jgi:uncharacterized membrane protein
MSTKFDDVRIRVNGTELELNSFVKSVVAGAVSGMVSSLRLDGIPKTIEISMKAQPSQEADKK